MNYRVGLGGFLASNHILEDMKKDGLEGVGNWGLTDQQTALEWVQRYITSFGGDKSNVTVFGLSAGGISIGHQLRAKNPPVFHRTISMSGVENTIPTMSLEEQIFKDSSNISILTVRNPMHSKNSGLCPSWMSPMPLYQSTILRMLFHVHVTTELSTFHRRLLPTTSIMTLPNGSNHTG